MLDAGQLGRWSRQPYVSSQQGLQHLRVEAFLFGCVDFGMPRATQVGRSRWGAQCKARFPQTLPDGYAVGSAMQPLRFGPSGLLKLQTSFGNDLVGSNFENGSFNSKFTIYLIFSHGCFCFCQLSSMTRSFLIISCYFKEIRVTKGKTVQVCGVLHAVSPIPPMAVSSQKPPHNPRPPRQNLHVPVSSH